MRHQPAFLLFALWLCSLPASSQNSLPDTYIRQALDSNHGLKEQQFLLEKNVLALEEARRLYLPTVGFGASYTLAAGGRNIQLPVGDLLNPVYSTLNQLTQSNAFPQIENVSEQFPPNNFYDARFRITQPIINREIYYNRKIKEAAISLKQLEIQAFKRELAKDVQVAYYQYMQAGEAVRIYENALGLLAESQRTNESLLRNDKIIPSVLSRVESEITSVKAQQNQALTNQRNAAAYLNFLLNRPLETPIETEPADPSELAIIVAPPPSTQREELAQLATAREINALVVEMESSYKIPKVGAQVDIGSQNFDFQWGGYVLGGLSLEVPIWAAGRNKLQVQQAQLDGMALGEKTQQVQRQIELQTLTARNSLLAEVETWQSYQAQLSSAQRSYRDTERRYREGIANYIELLDARSQVTNVELQQTLAMYNIFIKKAELERAMAAYPLP